ncbi:MAG TPA: hypothetical protein VJ646_14415 [Candidatus Binatia bacterium]|nr:hypothetical protein [Candidatus Binatia bacterium]
MKLNRAAQKVCCLMYPSTRAPALAGGSRSGFRPKSVVEGATDLPVGLHSHCPRALKFSRLCDVGAIVRNLAKPLIGVKEPGI